MDELLNGLALLLIGNTVGLLLGICAGVPLGIMIGLWLRSRDRSKT